MVWNVDLHIRIKPNPTIRKRPKTK